MTAPGGSVDIANIALDYLAQEHVSDIESPSTEDEDLIALHYDAARQGLLREFVWNFAKVSGTANRQGDAPEASGFADDYNFPAPALRILNVGGEIELDFFYRFDIQGRQIYIDNDGAETVNVRFIKDVTDVALFDPLFINILALKLALRLAYKFTQKRNVVQNVKELLSEEIIKAVSIDGQERPPLRISRSKTLSARRSGVSGADTTFVDFRL